MNNLPALNKHRPSNIDTGLAIQPRSEQLTLIGFEREEMWKIYDAVEACGRLKKVQTVEIFVHSLEEADSLEEMKIAGLCLIRIPDMNFAQEQNAALSLLSDLVEIKNVTTIPVLGSNMAGSTLLKAVGRICPVYLNHCSRVLDFKSIFTALLFGEFIEPPSNKAEIQTKSRRPKSVSKKSNIELSYI